MYGVEDSFGGSYSPNLFSLNTGSTVWTIVSLILAFIGCFVVYFLFVIKKDNPKQKFLSWLKEFLDFKKMLIEPIMKTNQIQKLIIQYISKKQLKNLLILLKIEKKQKIVTEKIVII